MSLSRAIGVALLTTSLFALGACEDAQQKAERKYESAEALTEKGDVDRALVELRGVFTLAPEHLQARLLYARLNKERGDIKEAFSHYALVTEQHPDNLEARLELGEMAFEFNQWDVFQRQVAAAVNIAPDDPRTLALTLGQDLRAALNPIDPSKMEDLRERARTLLSQDPSLRLARWTLIESLVQLNDLYGGLEALGEAIALEPENQRYIDFKLNVLGRLGDQEQIGETLRQAAAQFPENDGYKLSLVRWYVGNDDVESADQFLRDQIAANGTETKPRVTYIQFLLQLKGTDAAIAQLDRFIEEGTDDTLFRTLRASTRFDKGERDEAKADLRALLEGQEPSDRTRDMKVTLARMLAITGEGEDSQRLVEEVLAEDPNQVEALKLRADWLIERDRVGDAIVTLRTALDQAPNDPGVYTLLAKAHEREGNRDLLGENLSLAAENSNYGAGESVRYGRFLLSEEKYPSARDVTLQALRRKPNDLALLKLLSDVYLGMADYPRTEQIIKGLRGLDDPNAKLLATSLEASLLQRMQRTDESMELLRGMLDDESTALMAQAAIIRSHLQNGDTAAARAFLNDILAQTPDVPGVRFLNAALLGVEGNFDQAATIYRDLLAEDPKQEVVWRAYVSALIRTGDSAGAEAAMNEALTELPDSMNLLWLKASAAEQNGRIEEAIEIYQQLYDRNSNSTIVANNLASLMSTFRTGDEDLQRAYVIARRLKGSDIPAFQDTYGWIAFRLGDTAEAVDYLAQAASGLQDNALVQEHYAEALKAAGQFEQAAAQYDKTLALIPEEETDRRAALTAQRDEAATRAKAN